MAGMEPTPSRAPLVIDAQMGTRSGLRLCEFEVDP